MTRKIKIYLLLLLFLAAFAAVPVLAQTELPDEFQMPGRVEGTGVYFEITDSEYLNITLQSSEPIKLVLESVPEMIILSTPFRNFILIPI